MTSSRVKLINCDEDLVKVILKGDDHLSKYLGVNVPSNWSEFGIQIFEYTLRQIKDAGIDPQWLAYLPVEINENTLLGTCGFKGSPDSIGMVELGYEVCPLFRNKGYATEVASLLLAMAFDNEDVHFVQAHTLAVKNASVRVLEKCGFNFVEEYRDENDGQVWRWNKSKLDKRG